MLLRARTVSHREVCKQDRRALPVAGAAQCGDRLTLLGGSSH